MSPMMLSVLMRTPCYAADFFSPPDALASLDQDALTAELDQLRSSHNQTLAALQQVTLEKELLSRQYDRSKEPLFCFPL